MHPVFPSCPRLSGFAYITGHHLGTSDLNDMYQCYRYTGIFLLRPNERFSSAVQVRREPGPIPVYVRKLDFPQHQYILGLQCSVSRVGPGLYPASWPSCKPVLMQYLPPDVYGGDFPLYQQERNSDRCDWNIVPGSLADQGKKKFLEGVRHYCVCRGHTGYSFLCLQANSLEIF